MNESSTQLIVNADDFGMSIGINEGIERAHVEGILTSASLMVRYPAAEHAVKVSRAHPGISLGLHLDFCEWVYRNEEWQLLYEVVPLSDELALRRELKRQIALFQTLVGRLPSHIDSHQHVHRSDPIRSMVLEAARQLDVPVREATPGIHYCGRFYGQTNKGITYPEGISSSALVAILEQLAPGTVELACHPARVVDFESVYAEERVCEFEVLRDPAVRDALSRCGIRLTNFNEWQSG